jgi:exosortase
MSTPRPPSSFASLGLGFKLSLLGFAVLTAALSFVLWPHWRQNRDLSHGIFMPIIFLVLLHEGRRGTLRWIPAGAPATLAQAGLLLLGLLGLAASGLYAASLGWSHDLVAFTLTASFVVLLAAGLLVAASDSVRWLPCNWNGLVALGLWLLCAPIPPGTYSRLTLTLQLMVSGNVLRALHLLGVAAVRQGNIIELATTAVGIEEACSGVRSLISCVFAGIFFSATLVRRPWSRACLILLAAPLALTMNFLRSLTLTLLANSGVNLAGVWHDFTGFAVLGLTALLLGGLALLLERSSGQSPPPVPPSPAPSAGGFPSGLLAGSLLVALALVVFFVASTRPPARSGAPVPDLAAMLPATAAGWRVDTSVNLYQFRDTLQTDHLAQRTYSRLTDHGPEIVTIYLAYWPPGQASVSLVASHTPDACWPGAGWEALPVSVPRVRLTIADRVLATAEMRDFQSGDYLQNVWYWHLYDGQPLAHENPNSPAELLRLAWHYGFRQAGDQLFVRISSNRSWENIRHEPFIESLFARLQPLGL